MATYFDLLDAVESYYGEGSDQWLTIAKYGISSPDALNILKSVPGVELTVSKSGRVLGWDYSNPFETKPSPVSTINSNTQTGGYGERSFTSQIPGNADTTHNNMSSGMKTVGTGAKVASVVDKVSLAVAGVSIGTKLGKLIDQAIYSINPEWWDEHFPSINPETWDDMATTELGKDAIRAVFGLEQDSATMYMDERMLAYTYQTLLANGAYSSGGYEPGDLPVVGQTYENSDFTSMTLLEYLNTFNIPYNPDDYYIKRRKNNIGILFDYRNGVPSLAIDGSGTADAPAHFTITSSGPYTVTQVYENYATLNKAVSFNIGNIRLYYYNGVDGYSIASMIMNPTNTVTNDFYNGVSLLVNLIESTPLDGVTDDSDASIHINPDTLINPTTQQPVTPQDNVDDVVTALQNQYPDLFTGRTYADIPQQDGTVDRIYYIPTPYPNMDDKEKPVTGPNRQGNPQVNPQTNTTEQLQDLTDTITTPTTAPPDTGEGSSPTIVTPTGSANALFAIYNPSQAEINSFGAWLWSPNFVDQLLKLFNDPMQSIIGLHKIFASPQISGTGTIHVGYLDSGVSSNLVGNQYTDVDCGTINLAEYFGNVFDYAPYTDVNIFLPFIGIHQLSIADVMRSSIHVVYHVDVLTGACLADVEVIRDGSGGVLYSYAGDCAVRYPISSGSYMGVVASIASVVGGVIGTIASGGALAPVAMGAIGGALNAHTDVNHSGSFSGNAGAMGIKTPYLIISRPQTALADNFPMFDGYPANHYTTVGSCTGYIRANNCHVESVPATDRELSEIENFLLTGVII